MIRRCNQCGAEISTYTANCLRCGAQFEASAAEDILQRPANSQGWPPEARPGPGIGAYGAVSAPRKPIALWVLPVSIVGFICVVGLLGWGGYSLWMAGPGGDFAFNQYNYAGNDASTRHDYATANDDYAQMIALRPHKPDGYLLKGINENRAGEFSAAIADDTAGLTATNSPSVRGDFMFNRAWAESSSGRTKSAIADYIQARATWPQETDPCCTANIPERVKEADVDLSMVDYRVKDYAGAAAAITSVIAQGQADYHAYEIRGKAELGLSQNAAAVKDFSQSLAMNSSDIHNLADIAKSFNQQSQYGAAVATFAAGVRDNPDSVLACGSLGWYQYETGQLSQAVTTDKHALALPDATDVEWIKFNLALTYANMGQGAQAQSAYANALTLSTPRDRQGGIGDLQDALAKHPGSKILQASLAQVQAASSPFDN